MADAFVPTHDPGLRFHAPGHVRVMDHVHRLHGVCSDLAVQQRRLQAMGDLLVLSPSAPATRPPCIVLPALHAA